MCCPLLLSMLEILTQFDIVIYTHFRSSCLYIIIYLKYIYTLRYTLTLSYIAVLKSKHYTTSAISLFTIPSFTCGFRERVFTLEPHILTYILCRNLTICLGYPSKLICWHPQSTKPLSTYMVYFYIFNSPSLIKILDLPDKYYYHNCYEWLRIVVSPSFFLAPFITSSHQNLKHKW